MIPEFESEKIWPEDEDEAYRVLPKGVHSSNLCEVHERFVEGFPESISRKKIYKGLNKLLQESQRYELSLTQWLCGSYVTTKESPDDIDIVSLVDSNALNSLSASGRNFVDNCLMGEEKSKNIYKSHSFCFPVYPIGHPMRSIYERNRTRYLKLFGNTRKLKNPDDANGALLPGVAKGLVKIIIGDVNVVPEISDKEKE